ncbi:MAG: hypothetical protein ACKVOW_12230 [Chitinophagaceae bacterium]
MLSAEEKRFVRSWEYQRKDGKRSYFLLYIITGTIVSSIIVSFVAAMLSSFSMPERPWIIPIISFVITSLLTIYSWQRSERRLKEIIKREIRDSKTFGEEKISEVD